ncbi:MAG TPA: beta-propeller fold lactonase family protein [Mucilaginibacter sp.]|jgi:gliding motility-associated-like protein
MKRFLFFINIIIYLFYLLPKVAAQGNQTVLNGGATAPINFPGAGCIYDWNNNMSVIGLPSSGRGNIASFTASNTGSTPVTATITATLLPDWFAYVTNETDNTVSVIDITKNVLVATVPVGAFPTGVTVSPDGGKVYVVNGNGNSVSVINTITNSVTASIPVGSEPSGAIVSPDGSRLYVTNFNDNTISIINTTTNAVISTIPAGKGPEGIAISPDGSHIYVANQAFGSSSSISIINLATKAISTVVVGNAPISVLITPDGSKAYVANEVDNTVSVINTSNNVVIATVPVGNTPIGMSVSPDGTRVYVANLASNDVSVINTVTNVVSATIPVGVNPAGISASPDGSHIYVANNTSNNVSVIDATTNTVSSSIAVGNGPVAFGNFITGGTGCSTTPITFTIAVNPAFVQPAITAGALTGRITACVGSASASPYIGQFTVSASNLTAIITVTAPAGFEVSLAPASGYGGSLTIAAQQVNNPLSNMIVYVRSSASVPAGYISGNVVLTSAGATNQVVPVTGFINALPGINIVTNQTFVSGTVTTGVTFTGTSNVVDWINDTPSIGLAASGNGNIAAFTAVNNSNVPVIATITATPSLKGFAYIANFGSHNVSVINIATNTVVATVPVGADPLGVSVSPDGSKAYISNEFDNTVSVINTSSNTVAATIPVGASPSGLAVSPNGSRLYVANGVSNTVSVINTANNTAIATITMGSLPFGIAVSPDGSSVYVSNYNSNTVSVINAASNLVIATISVGLKPIGIVVSADGSKVYAVNQGSNNVSVINASSNTIAATIPVGQEPTGICISPDGSRLYVTNTQSNTVSVINTVTNAIAATVPVDSKPYGISISSDGNSVYVANKIVNEATLINTLTNAVISTINVGTTVYSLGNFITPASDCAGMPTTFTIAIDPAISSITAAGAPSPLSTTYGTASPSTNFSVSGINLTAGISVIPPPGFEISTDDVNFSSKITIGNAGTIASTVVYIRLASSTPVGNYSGNIALNSSGAANVNVSMPISSVSPASLTIAADDKSRGYGQANPVLTVTYMGFVNSESPSQLAIQPIIFTPAILTSPVGQYPITVSGASSPNYNFTYVPGILTVTDVPQTIAFPNAFTPNGDGINDTWNIKYLDTYPNCTVNVYNRYGENVYSSIGYGIPWNGTYNGSALPTGSYYYIINLKNGLGVFSGNVTIIR